MSEITSGVPETAVPAPESGLRSRETLRGHMGTVSLLFTVLAFNAPLAILAGFIPVVVGFGNGLGAPLAFAIVGIVVLVFSVGLNAMAARMPRPGAFYSYVARGIGRPPGLAAGFVALLTYTTLGSGTYALFAVMADHFLTTVVHVSAGPWWVWAVIGWVISTTLSLFNIDISAKVLGVAMTLEVIIVLLWNIRVFWVGGPEGRVMDPFPHFTSGSLPLALVFCALCLTGFESLQVFREETRDPGRTVPRATYLAVAMLTVLYAVSTYAYIIGEGASKAISDGAADATGSVLASIHTYVSSVVSDAASLLLLSSSFAACLAIQNITARYFYALGKDRVLPARLGAVNARHGSPVVSASVSGIIMLVVLLIPVLSGWTAQKAYTAITGIGAYTMVALWVATSLAVVVFFRVRTVERIGLWHSVIAPVLSFLALGVVLVMATIHIVDIIGDSFLGHATLVVAVVVALAGAGLALWWRRRDAEVYESIGSQD